MRRRLLNLLSALSLVPCAAVLVLWFHSTDHITSLVLRRTPDAGGGDTSAGLVSAGGGLYWMTSHHKATEGGRPVTFLDMEIPPRAWTGAFGPPDFGFWGFACNRAKPVWAGADEPRYVRVPFWFLTAVAALLPLARVGAWRHRQRAAEHGRCARCGYDLRATPDRCPECGTARRSVPDAKGERQDAKAPRQEEEEKLGIADRG